MLEHKSNKTKIKQSKRILETRSSWSSASSVVNLSYSKSLAFSIHSVVANNLSQLLNAELEINKLTVENRLRVVEGKITKKVKIASS